MDYKDKLIYGAIGFFLGALCCYIGLQFTYFEIDRKVSIVNSFISALGIIVGLYIAISLRKQTSQQANSYNFVLQQFTELRSEYLKLESIVLKENKMPLSNLVKMRKAIELSRKNFETTLPLFNLETETSVQLGSELEELNDIIEALPISNNIYSLTDSDSSLKSKTSKIREIITKQFQEINKNLS
ncbi:MAG: hypothetical protein ACRDCN_01685 [Tannerellaceae bacterium]